MIRRNLTMAKRTVKDLDVAGKKLIVRCDFNVPRKDGKITNDNRIIQALPTIKYLIENNAKIILMSHLGKVKTEEDKAKNDLRCVAERLAELVDTKVSFCPVTRGEELENMVADLKDGEIVLMQNTRYEKGESKNDPELAQYWASLGEVFVEDAFGSVHRAHASTAGIPSIIKENGLGFLVEKEVTMLGKAVDTPERPFIAIIGGAKVSDKIAVVDNLLKKADKVIVGGGMAYTFMAAKGKKVGDSLLEEDKIELINSYINDVQIRTGADVIVLDIPDGFMKYSDEVREGFGIRALMTTSAVSIDFFILNIPSDQIDGVMMPKLNTHFEQKYNISIDVVAIDSKYIQHDDTIESQTVCYYPANDRHVDEAVAVFDEVQSIVLTIRLNDRNRYADVVSRCVSKLSGIIEEL